MTDEVHDSSTFGDPFDPEAFFAMASRVGHGAAIGMEYRGSGDQWVELALPWHERLVGIPDSGVLASGAIVSLVDTCGGAAVWLRVGQFVPMVTIDLRLDYFRPAAVGETVIARCHCDRLTRRVGFMTGIAHTGDPERPVARATGTYMVGI